MNEIIFISRALGSLVSIYLELRFAFCCRRWRYIFAPLPVLTGKVWFWMNSFQLRCFENIVKFKPDGLAWNAFISAAGWLSMYLLCIHGNQGYVEDLQRVWGAFCCACAKKVCSARSAPFGYFQRAFAGFQLSDRHLSVILFGKGWKSMTSLPPFLTLWILVEFAGSSDEDILMIKVRTKREKRPKTWSLRFDLLTIKMCTWDYKPWRLVLRCWFLTSMNHEVVCRGDREEFVTIIEQNYLTFSGS